MAQEWLACVVVCTFFTLVLRGLASSVPRSDRYCSGSRYHILREPWRSVRVEERHPPRRCDNSEGFAKARWYRFAGQAGAAMPTEPPPSDHRCGSDAPVWVNGTNPRYEDGVVKRKACARYAGDTCAWKWTIRVKRCPEGFLIYKLTPVKACRLTYCGIGIQNVTVDDVAKPVANEDEDGSGALDKQKEVPEGNDGSPQTTTPPPTATTTSISDGFLTDNGDDIGSGESDGKVHHACEDYHVLDEPQRSVHNQVDSNTGGSVLLCDKRSQVMDGQWYRFSGEGGDKMPTERPLSDHRCGTHAPVWMKGRHPTVKEGAVTRTVCAFWRGNDCNWSWEIDVMACPGGYFVYKLHKPEVCLLAYCTTDGAPLTTVPHPTPSISEELLSENEDEVGSGLEERETSYLATYKGWHYYKVPVTGKMTSANVKAACEAAGYVTPCPGDSGCRFSSSSCVITGLLDCYYPMREVSHELCGSTPSADRCSQLHGVYQFMHNLTKGGACGAESGGWCAYGSSVRRDRYALCATSVGVPQTTVPPPPTTVPPPPTTVPPPTPSVSDELLSDDEDEVGSGEPDVTDDVGSGEPYIQGNCCGDILRQATDVVDQSSGYRVPDGWTMCYIDARDTAYHDTPCKKLLTGIPGYRNARQLLAAGGNFGCWHGHSGDSTGPAFARNNVIEKSCQDGVQQETRLSAWNVRRTTLGVCIKGIMCVPQTRLLIEREASYLATYKGWHYYKVPVTGVMTSANVKATCEAAGYVTPCPGDRECRFSSSSCVLTGLKHCSPLNEVSKEMCGVSPNGCPLLHGVYQFMSSWGRGACGVESTEWCAYGYRNRYAFCATEQNVTTATPHDATTAPDDTTAAPNKEPRNCCGNILRQATEVVDQTSGYGVPDGWTMCYIDKRDTAYHDTPCKQLLKGIPGYKNARQLLAGGGNFGCWHGHSGDSPGPAFARNNVIEKSCQDDVQQETQLSAWNVRRTTLGVCIKGIMCDGAPQTTVPPPQTTVSPPTPSDDEDDVGSGESNIKGKNLALGKTTEQSSLWDAGYSSNAVDGDRSTNWYSASCTHTAASLRDNVWDVGTTNPWWYVDLGSSHPIGKVVIVNRRARENSVTARITPFELHVGNSKDVAANPTCGRGHVFPAEEDEMVVRCGGIHGRYVGIRLPGENRILTLCEVEVYAEPFPSDDEDDDVGSGAADESVDRLPCVQHHVVDDLWRHVSNTNESHTCDDDSNIKNGQWHRFMRGRRSMMIPTERPLSTHRCGTHAPVWMKGRHPTVEEGVVTRTACAFWGNDECHWSWEIDVMACPGDYFVYKLQKPTHCNLAYCTTNANLQTTLPPVTTVPVPTAPVPSDDEDHDVGSGEADDSVDDGPCAEHYKLDGVWRNVNNIEGTIHVRKRCDKKRGELEDGQWHRFTGKRGSDMMIPTERPLSTHRCRTHAPVWMKGRHPTVEEGVVTRTACAFWGNDECHWSWEIDVMACPGDYYVYKLQKPSHCNLAYCTTYVTPRTRISSQRTIPTPTEAPPSEDEDNADPKVLRGSAYTHVSPLACEKHYVLDEPWRSVKTHRDKDYKCDQRTRLQHRHWYRFVGAGGDMMPTKRPPATNRCGTHAPVWMKGGHPNVEEGAVKRRVCAFWEEDECHWSWEIYVMACPGGYYVYRLPKPKICQSAYCTTDSFGVDAEGSGEPEGSGPGEPHDEDDIIFEGSEEEPLPSQESINVCPENNVVTLPSGKKYVAGDGTRTYRDAQKECRRKGGIVAIPRSEEEKRELVFLKNCVSSDNQFWLGVRWRSEGWMDGRGTPLGDFTTDNQFWLGVRWRSEGWMDGRGTPLGDFTTWAPGEPDDRYNGYRCAHVVYGSKEGDRRNNWAETNCNSLYNYVCEIEEGVVPNAKAASCSDVKSLYPAGKDGEYTLYPFLTCKDVSIRVYCHNMASEQPEEFLTLPSGPGTNFANIYADRLRDNYGGRCDGPLQDPYSRRAGTTKFSKIRIKFEDSKVKVVRDDYTFATTEGHNNVSYGEAGDCYSWKQGCAKGTFVLDLTGTGLSLAPDVHWIMEERHPEYISINDLFISEDRTVASARCGGWCGHCWPAGKNLLLSHPQCDSNSQSRGKDMKDIYRGCYKDGKRRRLPHALLISEDMTADVCVKHCREKGYSYAGTQYHKECWCGDKLPRRGPREDNECATPCGGNQKEMCGGEWRLSVYEVESIVDAAAPPEGHECQTSDGASYRGTVAVTSSGRTCQRWDQQTPHEHTRTSANYPSSGLEVNFCRNPDSTSGVWCYTTDPNKRWELCDVPVCGSIPENPATPPPVSTEVAATTASLHENPATQVPVHKATDATSTVCPVSGYVRVNGACYKGFAELKTYDDARRRCATDGGLLAMPKDRAINRFINNLHRVSSWVGLTDANTEGRWVFEDGQTLKSSGFANWGRREPNNADGNEDCAEVLSTRSLWNDVPCNSTKEFTCQIGQGVTFVTTDITPTPTPASRYHPKVTTEERVTVLKHTNATLRCTLRMRRTNIHHRINWYRVGENGTQGAPLMTYIDRSAFHNFRRTAELGLVGRLEIVDDHASLRILRVKGEDSGTYRCEVILASQQRSYADVNMTILECPTDKKDHTVISKAVPTEVARSVDLHNHPGQGIVVISDSESAFTVALITGAIFSILFVIIVAVVLLACRKWGK